MNEQLKIALEESNITSIFHGTEKDAETDLDSAKQLAAFLANVYNKNRYVLRIQSSYHISDREDYYRTIIGYVPSSSPTTRSLARSNYERVKGYKIK